MNFAKSCRTPGCVNEYYTTSFKDYKNALKLCNDCKKKHNNDLKVKSKRRLNDISIEELDNVTKNLVKKQKELNKSIKRTTYLQHLYSGESKMRTKNGKSPGEGLYTNVDIPKNDRFATFNGETRNIHSMGVLNFRQRQYMLHVKKDIVLDTSDTSRLGCCMASKANCPTRLYLNDKKAATANCNLVSKNGEVYLVAARNILRGEEIVVTYGTSFKIKNCPNEKCGTVLEECNSVYPRCKHLVCVKCYEDEQKKKKPKCPFCKKELAM